MRRVLVQPDAGGRISGGYLYNQRMAEHAPADRPLELGAETAPELSAGDLLLVDSLFLHPDRLPRFVALRERGVRVGMLLHALPSFIERATAGLASHEPSEVERALLAGLDFLVVPGPYLRAVLAPLVPVPIHVCPPGIDGEWRRAAPPPPRAARELVMLSAGAVTPIKGFDDMVDALARLGPDRLRWEIAGSCDADRDHVASLMRRIDDAGLSGRVRLLGQRSVAETRALFAAADLFALPSHTENHPLTAMEALASCVPAVGYDVGGVSAIVSHGETGLLAPHGDVTALARELSRLLDDGELRRRMTERCWERRDQLASWPEAARVLAGALDAAAA
jgi:glycosyltransferase involved in cell wall biosynthesis